MSGKSRPSLRRKTLFNVEHYSNLCKTDIDCIKDVFAKYDKMTEQATITNEDTKGVTGGPNETHTE